MPAGERRGGCDLRAGHRITQKLAATQRAWTGQQVHRMAGLARRKPDMAQVPKVLVTCREARTAEMRASDVSAPDGVARESAAMSAKVMSAAVVTLETVTSAVATATATATTALGDGVAHQ